MIQNVQILDNTHTAVDWLPKVPAFRNQTTYTFSPGLNILWGANGSGKSSLLRLLSRMFLCEQGQDEQKATFHSLHEVFKIGSNDPSRYDAIKVLHDGSPVLYLDSGVGKGQLYAGAFDDDFFTDSLASFAFKGSSGQTTYYRLDNVVRRLIKKDFKEPDLSKVWDKPKKAILEGFLKGTLEKSHPTILIDEPERSLDIMAQVTFWNFIRSYQDKYQFIIATHNLFACNLSEANYIPFGDPKYLDHCREIQSRMNSPKALSEATKYFNSVSEGTKKPKKVKS